MDSKEMQQKIEARIKSNGFRGKFGIYEDVKQMLRNEILSGEEYENAIKYTTKTLGI